MLLLSCRRAHSRGGFWGSQNGWDLKWSHSQWWVELGTESRSVWYSRARKLFLFHWVPPFWFLLLSVVCVCVCVCVWERERERERGGGECERPREKDGKEREKRQRQRETGMRGWERGAWPGTGCLTRHPPWRVRAREDSFQSLWFLPIPLQTFWGPQKSWLRSTLPPGFSSSLNPKQIWLDPQT